MADELRDKIAEQLDDTAFYLSYPDKRKTFAWADPNVLPGVDPHIDDMVPTMTRDLMPLITAALAEAWIQGHRVGRSEAMRLMSDEPDLQMTLNPYQQRGSVRADETTEGP